MPEQKFPVKKKKKVFAQFCRIPSLPISLSLSFYLLNNFLPNLGKMEKVAKSVAAAAAAAASVTSKLERRINL